VIWKLIELILQIKSVKAQLDPLQALYNSLISDRRKLENELSTLSFSQVRIPSGSLNPGANAGKMLSNRNPDRSSSIDYQTATYPWSTALTSTLQKTFKLSSFRFCQMGVINAAMDDRDIVCVMPTGGGKSLTYQLPAIIGGKGLTVVISPLLALIWDQVRALRELGVECVVSVWSVRVSLPVAR
jgi:ATP-dependent DNA helicase Q1